MKKKAIKTTLFALITAILIGALALLSGCLGTNGRDGKDGESLNIYDIWEETKEQTDNPDLTFDEFLREYLSYDGGQIAEAVSLKAAINRSLLSVVAIITTFIEGYSQQSYYGSGVIVDIDKEAGDMTIVTNCHVVYSADAVRYSYGTDTTVRYPLTENYGFAKSVRVWLYGSEYSLDGGFNKGYDEAEIIAASKTQDIAVLKVTNSDIVKSSSARAAVWSNEEEAIVGETVYAVGNANGDDIAASVGYISKDSETIKINMGSDKKTEYFDYRVLRTDTAINGGNSGGGLFNASGELVGIVNAKTISDDIDNMGYALCASTVRRVVDKLIAEADGNSGYKRVNPNFQYEVTDRYNLGLVDNVAQIKEVVSITGAAGNYSNMLQGDQLTHVKVERSGRVVEDIAIERLHNLEDALLSIRSGDTVTYTLKGQDEHTQTISYTSSSMWKEFS